MNGSGLLVALLALLTCWTLLLAAYARPLRALWREPVFKWPVAILESDDWGAGPLEQAPALERLRTLLTGVRNARGEHPVMTVGVILETIDRDATRASAQYVAVTLDDARQAPILDALRAGEEAGVFALQLHGLAHYWPPSLMACRHADSQVSAWLTEPGVGWTETLPSPLQSRWTDAATLPSRPLPDMVLAQAVTDEVSAWLRIFRAPPSVAVPTTFVWTSQVEAAWSAAGIGVMVTPGARHEGRDADGAPSPAVASVRNGERGSGGLLLLVRDVYFEPAFGHAPARLAAGVVERAVLGRPALIEMHRFNFCGPRATPDAYAVLQDALEELLARVPAVRFTSSAALAAAIASADPDWLETSPLRRLAIWARRARSLRTFDRLARLSGLVLPLRLLDIRA